jgi:tellurite resistance protein TerC
MTPGELAAWLALGGVLILLLLVDVRFFARGREPRFREGAIWSLGWLAIGLLAAVAVYALADGDTALAYLSVYVTERSLSLDNLFVFILLFAYFQVPVEQRAKLLFWGIVTAVVLRALAIVAGVALLERFHALIYVLGALLLVIAYRILRGVNDTVNPRGNLLVRGIRRVVPVTEDYRGGRFTVREGGRLAVTPLVLALASIVLADIAFAIDSIPAAFALTRDPLPIAMGNVFALLGLRALFVLVQWLLDRFRYIDETIALVLVLVAAKLLLEEWVTIGQGLTFGLMGLAFAVGIGASLLADRLAPEPPAERAERTPPRCGPALDA